MIEVSHASFAFDRPVLSDISFTLHNGEILGIVGPNGSGKSTLLDVLAGRLRPGPGAVTINERSTLSTRERSRLVAVVEQEAHSQRANLTVWEMVLLGRHPHQGVFARPTAQDKQTAVRAIEMVGLTALRDSPLSELSGGERQRTMIARALAQDTGHLLLDEPTNHLDVRYQYDIMELVTSLESSVIIVLHDLNLALRYCDRILLLADGRIRSAGPPAEALAPALVTEIYGIDCQLVSVGGTQQLVFAPRGAVRKQGL